ncbi:MAG: NUDIX domain-containing protein [Planctomycetota bacterium]|nr:NUDIX domain-containing protein [Planctomycetota bacterium]
MVEPVPAVGGIDDALDGVVGAGTREDPRQIVELWLAVPTDEGWRLLMCLRIPRLGGFWQGVSGRVEQADATLRAAALRELDEELRVTEVDELIDMQRCYDFKSMNFDVWYRKRCMGVLLPRGTTAESVTLSEEHEAVRLMTFEEARRCARFPEYVWELDAFERLLVERP